MSDNTETLAPVLTEVIIDCYATPAFERLRADPEMAEIPVERPEEARAWVMEAVEHAEPIDPEACPLAAEALDLAVDLADWSRVGAVLAAKVADHLEHERQNAFAEPA